jgi:hypothetical protein
MRSKIFSIILAIIVLSSMIFTCTPINFAAQSSPTLSASGSNISYGKISAGDPVRLDPVASQEYWGSSQSDKFHYPSCRWAKRINKGNLIVFRSRQEALDSGYVACKVCRP